MAGTKTPIDLIKRQREILVESLSHVFTAWSEMYIEGGSLKCRWKDLEKAKQYNDGILMLEYLDKQINEYRKGESDEAIRILGSRRHERSCC